MKSKSSDIYLNSKLIKIERAPTLRALHSEHNYITKWGLIVKFDLKNVLWWKLSKER